MSTHELPAAGRSGSVPECPLSLGDAGGVWWKWAWKTPQASRWDDGSLYFVARRARLEDHAAALDFEDGLDLADLLAGVANVEATKRVEWALSTLKRSASGEVSLFKEMRELDNRLGLNPKGLADLRWSVKQAEADGPQLASVTPLVIDDPRVSEAS